LQAASELAAHRRFPGAGQTDETNVQRYFRKWAKTPMRLTS
jgi:hypothetical protein